MPVETEETIAQANGNGSATDFPFNFPFLEADDMIVTETDSLGVDTLQVLGVDYTITGAGTSSGEVKMVIAPPVGVRLTMERSVEATQKLNLEFKGKLDSNGITRALDKLTMLVQQVATLIFGGSVIRFPSTDPTTVDGLLPPQAARLGTIFGFDATLGNPNMLVIGDLDNIGVLLNEPDMVSNSVTQASSQSAIKLFVEDKILDQDGFDDNDPLRAPSQQSAKQYIADQIELQLGVFDPLGLAKAFTGLVAPLRHLLANDNTLGNDASGSDHTVTSTTFNTLPLFTHLWDNFSNTNAPIFDQSGTPTTRGVDAATDFGDNKRLTVPSAVDRVLIGIGTHATAIGQKIGSNEFELSLTDLPEIDVNVTGGGGSNHDHPFTAVLDVITAAGDSGNPVNSPNAPTASTTGLTDTTGSVAYDVLNTGEATGDAVSKIQQSFGVNFIFRL